jgi:peptidoglycan-associated lipoprotein
MTMNSISFATRSVALALSVAPLFLIAACATATPPAATTPSALATTAPTTAPRSVEPTNGTIFISDEIRTACNIRTEDALFAFDSSSIEQMEIRPLNAVALCFTSGPLAGRAMRLIGHADLRGPSEYNMALGQRRADSVEGYVDRRGVQRGRVATTSRGAMDATGQDEAGWAHDRRVDVQLGT